MNVFILQDCWGPSTQLRDMLSRVTNSLSFSLFCQDVLVPMHKALTGSPSASSIRSC